MNSLDELIIHIPHSSLDIPDSFKSRLIVDNNYFEEENQLICDYRIDEFIPNNFNHIVRFNYSRMYLDVERYLDDNKEEMSRYGMGVLYTKDSNGRVFVNRDINDNKYIINNLYKKHHSKLDNMVDNILNKYGNCFIIDLHSFSDEFVYKMFNKQDTPDICIGINKTYDKELLDKTISYFTECGYSIKINYPYEGSIISNKHPEVKSMMLEINKRIYLNNKNDYDKFYNCMMNYYNIL